MTICSYIIHPVSGLEALLATKLEALPELDIYPSVDQKIFIAVSDTSSFNDEKNLQDRLADFPEIQSLTLSYIHNPSEEMSVS